MTIVLKRPKAVSFETIDEAKFYAPKMLPQSHAEIAKVVPIILEVPLFAITRRKPSAANKKVMEPLPMINAVWYKKGRGFLRYTGPQLTQAHLTVLLTLVNLRAGQVISNVFDFRPAQLLAATGSSDKGGSGARLAAILDDLKVGQVRLWAEGQDENNQSLRVSFLSEWQPALTGNDWRVCLSESLLPVLTGRSLTQLRLPLRRGMSGALTTFIYGYLAANSGGRLPHQWVMFEHLWKASGSTGDFRQFKKDANKSLQQLIALGAIKGIGKVTGGFEYAR